MENNDMTTYQVYYKDGQVLDTDADASVVAELRKMYKYSDLTLVKNKG